MTTKELLGGGHRLWIEHAAERYLLQVTRSGKLIYPIRDGIPVLLEDQAMSLQQLEGS